MPFLLLTNTIILNVDQKGGQELNKTASRIFKTQDSVQYLSINDESNLIKILKTLQGHRRHREINS